MLQLIRGGHCEMVGDGVGQEARGRGGRPATGDHESGSDSEDGMAPLFMSRAPRGGISSSLGLEALASLAAEEYLEKEAETAESTGPAPLSPRGTDAGARAWPIAVQGSPSRGIRPGRAPMRASAAKRFARASPYAASRRNVASAAAQASARSMGRLQVEMALLGSRLGL